MQRATILLVSCLLLASAWAEEAGVHAVEPKEPETRPATVISPIKPVTVTHKPTTSSTTTVEPTQAPTTAEPSTTTTAKSTTTVKPMTTTVKPMTTTTEKPVSTTVAPVRPVPPPESGNWTVEQNGVVCILAQMAVQVDVEYVASNKTMHQLLNVPKNATASGFCGKTEQNLTLSWPSSNATVDNLTLHFVHNATEKHYSLHHLELTIHGSELPQSNVSTPLTLTHVSPSFSTGLTNSYKCLKHQSLDLKSTHNDNNNNDTLSGRLTVSDLQFQAFKTDNSTIFSLAKNCAFDTPDVVPIAVGCALAGLVVVVLIAYLVGRRRSQARGYLSM